MFLLKKKMRNNYFLFFFILLKISILGRVSLIQKDDDLKNIEKNKKNKDINMKKENLKEKINTLKILREKNNLYKEMHEKYNKNSKKDFLKKCDIHNIVNVIKEINFSEKHNKKLISNLGVLIKILFKGIEDNDLNAYEDNELTQKLSIFDIKNKMLIPYNPELGTIQKKESFFELDDVCLIEIISNYVKSNNYPNVICDNLIFKIKIPAHNFPEGIEKTVCCFEYAEAMNFLIKKKYKIKDMEMFFVDALEKNRFKYSYLFINGIDINEKYKIKENDFSRNNQIGSLLIKKYTENIL